MIVQAYIAFSFLPAVMCCFLLDFHIWCCVLLLFVITSVFSMWLLNETMDNLKVLCISIGLGLVFGQALNQSFTSLYAHDYISLQFSLYCCAMSFFHYSEYLSVAMFNPRYIKMDAFLLTHSREYGIALVASLVEMCLESYFAPVMKGNLVVISCGILLTASGEFIRKFAMYTAGAAFTHLVSTHKESGHKLVTRGLYKYCRHPSYVGWTLWSIGTQVILANPICVVLYACAVLTFYSERIHDEEFHLVRFFGEQYVQYQKRVPIGLPFIKGFDLEEFMKAKK